MPGYVADRWQSTQSGTVFVIRLSVGLVGDGTTEADRLHGYFGMVRIRTGQARGRDAARPGRVVRWGAMPR